MTAPLDPRLAGLPSRYSSADQMAATTKFEGLVKLRLGHAVFGSILLPEMLYVNLAGWRFYQPVFFDPPLLGFDVEPDRHEARFSVDVGGARASNMVRLYLEIRSDGLVRRYDDGAQLYRCAIWGPSRLAQHSSGRCLPRTDHDFDVCLSHFTSPSAYAAIRGSGELRSSRWNLQGTRELANAAYVYLTSLPSIRNEEDLRRIAMSSDATIRFQTTSSRAMEETLELTVYRGSTGGRTARLPVNVASDLLSPPHLLIHRPVEGRPYFEIVGPEIYRVGLRPGASLVYGSPDAIAPSGSPKLFDYLVIGDAARLEGLAAPYDEEETREVVHVERLDAGADLFDFWQKHSNSDQVSGRKPELRAFAPPT